MRIAKILAVTLLCIVLDMHLAKGDEIDSLLVEFDKNPTVMLSNRLMQGNISRIIERREKDGATIVYMINYR